MTWGIVIALLVAAAPARAAVELSARLEPGQVVPPPAGVAPTASGLASFTLDDDGRVRWKLQVRDLSGFATSTTIRLGRAGDNGGTVVMLTNPPPTGDHVGSFGPLDTGLLEALFAQEAHVVVATAAHPAGELRGQIMLVTVPGVTCACAGGTTRAFRTCVRKRLAERPTLRRSPAGRRLRRLANRAVCETLGRPRAARRGACCLPWSPADNVVVERLCAALTRRACIGTAGIPSDAADCAAASCGP